MNILLDTHIALWAIVKPEKLSKKALELLCDNSNDLYVSIVLVWEVAIKHSIHPDKIPMSEFEYVDFCGMSGFNIFQLKVEHVLTLHTLSENVSKSKEHKDPFDRIMIAQAKSEGFSLLTDDEKVSAYNEDCIIYQEGSRKTAQNGSTGTAAQANNFATNNLQ